MMVQAGAVTYNSTAINVFTKDFTVPANVKAMRWFCRASSDDGKLTTHMPCGNTAHTKRKSISIGDYISKAYTDFDTTRGCYYSPNLFYSWRRESSLQGFTANWIDIDVADHAALDEDLSKLVTAEIVDALWQSGLPMPTSIASTGSGGLHLYWLYKDPVMTKSAGHRTALTKHWRMLAKQLTTAMDASRVKLGYTGWSVDKSASHNPTGLMRLPNSIHHKTGRTVRYLKGGDAVNFNTFAQDLGSMAKVPVASDYDVYDSKTSTSKANVNRASASDKPRSRSIKKTRTVAQLMARAVNANGAVPQSGFGNRPSGQAQEFDTLGQRYALKDIMTQWEQALVQVGAVQKGLRDLTVFHLYNCARRIMDENSAWDYIVDINERFVRLPLVQLKSYLSSAARRVYYYGLPRLKQIITHEIGLVLAFPESLRKVKRGDSEVKRIQAQAGRQTSKQRSSGTMIQLVAELTHMTSSGIRTASLTPARLMKQTKLSRATVYRYWDKALQTIKGKELPTLNELMGDVKKVSQSLGLTYSTLCEEKEFLDLLVDHDPLKSLSSIGESTCIKSKGITTKKPPD
jgi:hypothetical protein